MEYIVKKLLDKSQEAFIMAIEIYNKPTLKYRVEGFSFFICNAWELLLKAHLLNIGENIYYDDAQTRTFSLEACVKKVMTNEHDPVRKNLDKIIDLRNMSTHFITEEYELIFVPLFQSCVINYTNKLIAYFNIDITNTLSSNFLTLSIKLSDIDNAEIKARYPKDIATKLLHTKHTIEDSLPLEGQSKYAITVNHDWALVKNPKHATATFSISSSAENSTYIMKQVIDPQKSYPFRAKRCIELINKWIKSNHIHFISPTATTEEKINIFTSNHFKVFCDFYNVKENSNYTYIYSLNPQPYYSYSQKLIDFIKEEIKKDPENIVQNLKSKLKKENKSKK